MPTHLIRSLPLWHLIGLMTLAAMPSAAQTWPSKPVTVIVPSTAGGAIDSYACTAAAQMGRQLKRPFIVDNRAGGGGALIGADAAVRAAPDGHTLFEEDSAVLHICESGAAATILPETSAATEIRGRPESRRH